MKMLKCQILQRIIIRKGQLVWPRIKRKNKGRALEQMTSLSSAIEKAASKRSEKKPKAIQVRSKELEAATQRTEAET
jgi:hypothetical protein